MDDFGDSDGETDNLQNLFIIVFSISTSLLVCVGKVEL